MTSEKKRLEYLQTQTITTCFMLIPPYDKLKDLSQRAILVKTGNDEKIGTLIPFDFAIVLGPQYLGECLSAEREMLVTSYLKILNNLNASSIVQISVAAFLEEIANNLVMKDFILVTQYSSLAF